MNPHCQIGENMKQNETGTGDDIKMFKNMSLLAGL